MTLTVLCVVVLVFYVAIWFFDSFFKSCMHYPYYAFLEGTGLHVGILNFSWKTTAFNRAVYRWSKNLDRSLKKWFTFGYLLTIMFFLPFAVWFLIKTIIPHAKSEDYKDGPEVKAMLLGVNIPLSDFWVYFLALAVCTIFHELGHAMAAANEDVPIIDFGIYVFIIVPVAFVQLNTEHLYNLPAGKRLRIFCAGVWHNLTLSAMAALLFLAAPIIFSVGYETDLGVRVTGFSDNSPLKGPRGFLIGDVITHVNGFEIKNSKFWAQNLQRAHERYGICTSADFVAQNDNTVMETIKDNIVECCRKDDTRSLCFEYMEPKAYVETMLPGQYSCLKPRDMVYTSFIKCTEENYYNCPPSTHCLKPILNNQTFLLITERKNDNRVIYLGTPNDLYSTMSVDQYFPRLSILSAFSPLQFERFMKYMSVFSMGIAFINILPCYATDGQYIAGDLILILAKLLNKDSQFIRFFTVIVVVLGTGLTAPTLAYTFYETFSEYYSGN